ncbi:MAG: hypothetical protein L3J81_01170, partial [Thermoplasmata archaeon]|nr:hypothetical protein [Thermoplasmata archaeon]
MSEESPRVFARWRREADPGPGYAQIPEDGVCLSAFLVLTDPSDPRRVVLGRLDPRADWGRLGALEGSRLERSAGRWMLPASHFLEYESPAEAGRRIASEQLERTDLVLDTPHVVSDPYSRPDATGQHWDLDFLFRGRWPAGVPLKAGPWVELAFVDPTTVPRMS